jgi:NADH-quinone oxidoreductase subunit N
MNAYLIAHSPLILGFALLLIVGALNQGGKDYYSHFIAVVAVAGTAALSAFQLNPGDSFYGGAIQVTAFSKAMAYVGLGLALIALVLAEDYLEKVHMRGPEWRMVVLAQCFGFTHAAMAGDLATLFIAFELVSIPSYVLVGFNHRDARANEAGMKYVLLGVLSSSLFLFGMAFLYGATGTLSLVSIRGQLELLMATGGAGSADMAFAKVALVLILSALLFKAAAAPFHNWLSDIYQGSNLASLAVVAGPAKVASFGLLALMLWGPFGALSDWWMPLLWVGAILSAVFGNFQAIAQTQVKRLLAYSAVVNAGFILIAISERSPFLLAFYLASYGLTTLGALAGLMTLGTRGSDIDSLDDVAGLGRRHPLLGAFFTLILMSYAGIPLTAGFAAKFGVVMGAFQPQSGFSSLGYGAMVTSVVLSLVSFFFYFKIVRSLWLTREGEEAPELKRELRLNYVLVLGFTALAILGLGVLMRLPGAS